MRCFLRNESPSKYTRHMSVRALNLSLGNIRTSFDHKHRSWVCRGVCSDRFCCTRTVKRHCSCLGFRVLVSGFLVCNVSHIFVVCQFFRSASVFHSVLAHYTKNFITFKCCVPNNIYILAPYNI